MDKLIILAFGLAVGVLIGYRLASMVLGPEPPRCGEETQHWRDDGLFW